MSARAVSETATVVRFVAGARHLRVELVETVRFARGGPQNRTMADELHATYQDCARRALERERAERVLHLLERLDTLPSVAPMERSRA